MIKRVVSAKEGEKRLSVEYNPITKSWQVSKRFGRLICVVPSHKSLIKVEGRKRIEDLRAYVKERFPESRYDIKLLEDRAYIALCRDCSECENIELEPFALARLFSLYEKEGFVIDFEHPIEKRWMSFQIEDPKPFRDVLELIKYLEEEGS